MKKKIIIVSCILLIILVAVIITFFLNQSHKEKESNQSLETTNQIPDESLSLQVMVLNKTNTTITVEDKNNIIYTFSYHSDDSNLSINVGDYLKLTYEGKLDANFERQDAIIINCENITSELQIQDMLDEGFLNNYYAKAISKLKTMTLEEKIAQILLVRYPNNGTEEQQKYQFGGYLFFAKDFQGKTKEEVINMINNANKVSKIPLLTAVDEEGGTVVRISSNPNLFDEPFKSPRELYQEGGFELIKEDTITKSNLLQSLGINLNLAPVVDVATNKDDYMYNRSIGLSTDQTNIYAKTVIEASKELGVSYTLKHFPGYGNNVDTHTETSIDSRSYDDIITNDIPPFQAGIKSGAEAVLVSHNIVTSIDENNPASLSPSIHNILHNMLDFQGIIITDDLDMGAVSNIENNVVKSIISGNNLIIVTDYKKSINEVKKAIDNQIISENYLDKLVIKIIAWKYYKGLLN